MNRFFCKIKAFFAAVLLLCLASCSALFDSDKTGSVCFSLSSEQVQKIAQNVHSSRNLIQASENSDANGNEISEESITLKLAIYDYDFSPCRQGEISYSFSELESQTSKTLFLDNIPVGNYAIVALMYYESVYYESEKLREPYFCGAEEKFAVYEGDNKLSLEMIKFANAFAKSDHNSSDKTSGNDIISEGYYNFDELLRAAKCSGEDSDYGIVCLLASEGKPFYTLLSAQYGILSIGICDVIESYPNKETPKTVRLRELAGIQNDVSSFSFLDQTELITVKSELSYNGAAEAEEKTSIVTYTVPYYDKTFSLVLEESGDINVKPEEPEQPEESDNSYVVNFYFVFRDSEEEARQYKPETDPYEAIPAGAVITVEIYRAENTSELFLTADEGPLNKALDYLILFTEDLANEAKQTIEEGMELYYKITIELSDGTIYAGEHSGAIHKDQTAHEFVGMVRQ